MSISLSLEINERVNEMVAAMANLDDNDVIPLGAIVADVIKALDPFDSIQQIKHRPIGIEWSVNTGPAIYALLLTDSWFSPFLPAIVYIGETDHLERRISEHERGDILFDGVRSVFIEHEQMRQRIENEVIAFLRRPESLHTDTLLNKRGRSRLIFR